MTDLELSKAKIIYKLHKKGKEDVLRSLSHGGMKSFLNAYANITQEKIEAIAEEEMLKRAFLSTFQNTEESSNLLVYINRIVRTSERIDDGQPDLESVNWELCKNIPEGLEKLSLYDSKKENLNVYSLYCDLETNRPLLLGDCTPNRFDYLFNILLLPDYIPQTESYHYNSQSLEKITKGSAKEKFNRLQLYYFRELLETSKKEEVIKRMKSLTKKELTNICIK